MNYIYGSLVWICIGCILIVGYLSLSICSIIMMMLPLSLSAPVATRMKDVSTHMTDIVSTYGFREETVDVSGVKIHCVIKDTVTEHGVTSGGGGGLVHLITKPPMTYSYLFTEPRVRLSTSLKL